MKIAYIYYLIQEKQFGVEAKIIAQGNSLERANIKDFDIYVLNPSVSKTVNRVQFVKFNNSPFFINYYRYLFQRYNLIERALPLKQYDYIILRYPLADQTGLAFTKKFKTITEHHTNELQETLARWQETTCSPMKFARWLSWRQEKQYGSQILQNCNGIIGVSEGVRKVQSRRANGTIPSITIGNGVDTTAITPVGFKPFDGKHLDLLFLGSGLRPWHGLDRVIRSFNTYEGEIKWKIHVVGNIIPADLKASGVILQNIEFHGVKTLEELDTVFPNMNLAINTMGLHRIGLESVSPLKACEYTARGIPFIMAYTDPNLIDVKTDMRFFLRFKNDESLIDVDKIIHFARQMSQRQSAILDYMYIYASTHMDWSVKLQQYVDFVAQLNPQSASGQEQ